MKKLFSFSLLLFLQLALSFQPAAAQSCTTATCNAVDASESAVLAALPSSSNQNATVVVNIPNNSAAWTTGFSYTIPAAVTSLTIQGTTSVACTGTAGSSSYACSATDTTTIQDAYATNNPLMTFTVGGASSLFRVTGLTVAGGSVGSSSNSKYNGLIQVFAGSAQVRIDHNHFNLETYSPMVTSVAFRTFAPITGVGDHNLLDLASSSGTYPFGFSDFGAYGDKVGNGDGTFNSSTPWGAATSFYVESNFLNGGVINDCGNAGSMVIRYNTINDASVGIQTHGTKSPAGPGRGCRAIEMYHNYFTGPTGSAQASAALGTKGTTALIWGNTLASGYYRLYQGGGDRQSGDENETNTPNGWGYCGTAVNGNGVGSPWDGNQNSTTGYPCLDGIGRGQTPNSLNGASFPGRLNSVTNTIAWPNQYLEPQYLWNNSIGSATYMLLTDQSANNQDYYYDCGSVNSSCSAGFTGATGTGYGTHASMPQTCTAGPGGASFTSPTGSYGVAYFATDDNSGQGQLWVCTSANTWTHIYTPYVYPHPLVSGTVATAPATPQAPTNLTGTVVQ